ncbi:MAG: amidohydrolase [Chloroflexi bacterium]|nr:amidohydrolase [Chloroflexota bacterium]
MPGLILRNARIWTGFPGAPPADCAAVEDGVFRFVGRAADVNPRPGMAAIDAGGRLVVPGLTDSHIHLRHTGMAMSGVDLKGVPSVEEACRRVAARAASLPPGTWIQGAGWDQNDFPGRAFPDRAALDKAAPGHPVVLTHTSGHCTWVNSLALRGAGITASTAAPAGGAIDLDAGGEPSGILRDNASQLVYTAIPRPTDAEVVSAIAAAARHANSRGLTGVHAMDVSAAELGALRALAAAGSLDLRTFAFLSARDLARWDGTRTGDAFGLLTIGGVKFFADGALGSLTAWMEEPYERTGGLGFPLQPVEDLEAGVRWCLEHGLATAVHAIGDRANAEVAGVFERVASVSPALPRRVEHAQLLAPGLARRFAQLGVTASVQPIHATQDMEKVDLEWGARGCYAYPFRSLLAAGVNLAFGSDSPVETLDPLVGIHAAVSRRRATGEPPAGWYPAECLPIEDALAAYTSGPARALGLEASLGSIAPGHAADFVVLSAGVFALPDPMAILDVNVDMTVVGGRVVFDRAG